MPLINTIYILSILITNHILYFSCIPLAPQRCHISCCWDLFFPQVIDCFIRSVRDTLMKGFQITDGNDDGCAPWSNYMGSVGLIDLLCLGIPIGRLWRYSRLGIRSSRLVGRRRIQAGAWEDMDCEEGASGPGLLIDWLLYWQGSSISSRLAQYLLIGGLASMEIRFARARIYIFKPWMILCLDLRIASREQPLIPWCSLLEGSVIAVALVNILFLSPQKKLDTCFMFFLKSK